MSQKVRTHQVANKIKWSMVKAASRRPKCGTISHHFRGRLLEHMAVGHQGQPRAARRNLHRCSGSAGASHRLFLFVPYFPLPSLSFLMRLQATRSQPPSPSQHVPAGFPNSRRNRRPLPASSAPTFAVRPPVARVTFSGSSSTATTPRATLPDADTPGHSPPAPTLCPPRPDPHAGSLDQWGGGGAPTPFTPAATERHRAHFGGGLLPRRCRRPWS